MAEQQSFPALNFSGQDLLFKKAAAAFLSKHSVDFQPVGDSQEEYQAVIKVRFGSNTTRASTAQDKELFKSTRANKDQSKILNKLKAMDSNNEIYNMVDEMTRLIEISKTQSSNENQERQSKNRADSDTRTSAKQKSRKLSVEKEKQLQKNCEALGQILKVKDIIKKEGAKKANSSGLGKPKESGKETILDRGNFQQKKTPEKPKLKHTEQKHNEIKIWGEYSETRALNSSLNRNNGKDETDKMGPNLVVEQPKSLDVASPPVNDNNSADLHVDMKENKDINNNPEDSKNEQDEKPSQIAFDPKVTSSPKNNTSLELGSESERKDYNKSPKKSQGQPKIQIKYLSGEKMIGRPEFKANKSPKRLEKQIPASARLPKTGLDYSFEEKRINFTPKRSLNFEHLSSGERIEYHQVLVDQARYSPTYALASKQKSGPYLLKDSFSKLVTETEKKKQK